MLDVTNKSKVIESLKTNEIDFTFVSVLPDNINIEKEFLIENKLYLIGNKNIRDEDKPLIYREEGSATRIAMEKYFLLQEGFRRKRLELTSNEAVKQAVIAGLGYSIMPLIGLKNELINKQMYILKSKKLPIKTEWYLIWLKGKKLSPVSQHFLKYIQTENKKIIKQNFDWYLKF